MELTEAQIAILVRYANRKISRSEAAKKLGGISERQVNRLFKCVELERVESPSHKKRSKAVKRRLAKEYAARLVKRKEITVEQAAARAGCSVRTIYRYLAKH